MAQKMIINKTDFVINSNLVVRKGDQPGTNLNSVHFSVNAHSQKMIAYGDANNIYVNELEISCQAGGGLIISDQQVISKSSALDDLFNRNDTIYVLLQGQSIVITSANTWT